MGVMVNELINFLKETFSPAVGVVLAAAIPVTELRAAIPLAVSLGMAPLTAFFWSVLGNIIPIPILLWILPKAMQWFTTDTWLGKRLDWWIARTLKKGDQVEKYGAIGLLIFTAIPLPGTGAWSASLAAVLFKVKPIVALWSISAGVLIAGVVITLVSIGLFH
jgi:uncharacterized membrane protein